MSQELLIKDSITITPERFTELLFQVAGGVSSVFLMRDPDLDFATAAEEVKATLVNVVDYWLENE